MSLAVVRPLPDEPLWGALARVAHLNGFDDVRSVVELLFEGQVVPSILGWKVDFPRAAKAFGLAEGGTMAFIRSHTLLSEAAALGEVDASLLGLVASGEFRPILGELMFSTPPEFRACSECAAEDVSRLGMAYWRRMHQMPVVLVCPEHERPLLRIAFTRGQLYKALPMVQPLLTEGLPACPGAGQTYQFLLQVARAAARLPSLSLDSLASTGDVLRGELRTRGLTNGRGQPTVRFGHEFHANLGWATPGESTSSLDWLNRPYALLHGLSDTKLGVAGRRMVLANWLFSDWSHFLEHCKWRAVVDAPMRVLPSARQGAASLPSFAEMRDAYRSKCLVYIQQAKTPTRTGFQRACQRGFTWLLHHDSAWLQAQLPLPGAAWHQLELL